MKTKLCMLFIMLLSAMTIAQNGINYKAVIKDGGGNVVANDLIVIQFAIIKTTAAGATVYEESHTPVTDDNGIIIVNIGEGTPISGVFTDVDWNSDPHFLNVEVNTGSGLVDLGTTEFKAVPYALNVTGLEKITEDGKTGWRLIGKDPADHSDIGNNAVDLSTHAVMPNIGASGSSAFAAGVDTYSTGTGTAAFGLENVASGIGSIVGGFDSLATGDHTLALGNNASASANNAVAFGDETRASGTSSFAVGLLSEASGQYASAFGLATSATQQSAFSIGRSTTASGINSFAAGNFTNASGINSMAIGEYNFDNINAVFMVGNGTSDGDRNNALTVEKSGEVGIGTSNPTSPLHVLQPTGASNTVRFESLDHPSGKDLLELQIPANSSASSQFIEMQNGGDIVAVVNGDGSARFKQLSIDGAGTGKLHINQNSQTVGTGLRFEDNTANQDWDITHGFALRFHYGGALRGFINAVTGAYTQSSDARIKNNIQELPSVLNRVEQLKPSTYSYNTDEKNTKVIGLIAQEVQKIFPEVVSYSEADDIYGIDYASFSVVAIKAIQEQQEQIETLKNKAEDQDQTIANLIARIETLENK